jgi:hypothetical protein
VVPTRILLAAVLCAPAGAAELLGSVIGAFDRKPIKRAEVVLRPSQAGRSAVGVTTDEQGRFAFYDVTAGLYNLEVSRTGYLPTRAAYQHDVRLQTPFQASADMTGITVRLLPAAVISGKVRYRDGEPAAGIAIEAYREFYHRGTHGYEITGRSRTDDLGQYRMFALPPGRYYIGAVAVPFRGNDDVEEQWPRDAYGQRVPPERTVTTFLPSTSKVSEAEQVIVAAGAEIGGADIYLARSRVANIRGRALHGGTGLPLQNASIVLLREDASGTGYLPSHAVVRPIARGEFEIRGVPPGAYAVEVRASERNATLYTRRSVVVGEAPSVQVDVLVQPEVAIRGQVFTANREQRLPTGLRVTAEPRNPEAAMRAAQVEPDGKFSIRVLAGQVYDFALAGAPGNVYLKSAMMDTVDILARGLLVPASADVSLTLTTDERGAAVQGETQPGATVTLVPETGQLLRFYEAPANEYGVFRFAGVAPGTYRILAWLDDPPCDLWNPSRRAQCGGFGQSLVVEPSGSHTLSLEAGHQ